MAGYRPLFLATCCAVIFAFMAASAAKADVSPSTAQGATLDRATVSTTIGGIVAELREGYVFPEKGALAAETLENALAEHVYAEVTDPERFAAKLTAQLREITKDSHLRVIFGSPFGNRSASGGTDEAGFEVKRLDGNIGYIHLSRFVPPDTFKPAADKAMRSVSDTAALLIDMRENGGGHPASVAYLVSFFLDEGARVHINDLIWRNRGTLTFRTEAFWSSPTPVHYLGKPVYVLVGPKTYSAGEEFAYDLQALRRAIVVGTVTRGGANPGGLRELGSDFFAVVPTGRAENPVTRSNWEGVGVRPDVQATLENTQETAVALAKSETGTPQTRQP
ncbi:S41 family peptidase [Afifella sp. IM 167]|uniref:S41 family peptidase n=1 Tax=Afifella sp. IM 167 TaxID=2033586 RepID=UPI001CCFCC77|nr:S41 family peptidase [Afifella sp. IM 167]MBZ8131861.1 peptidase S41 [Afifella sp. IM 167]